MLPSVNTNDGVVRDERVLVLGGDNLELGVLGVETKPSPTRALDGGDGGVEGGLEVVERAKVTLDGLLERTILEGSTALAGGGEVLPEERVVDVTTTVELDGGLELDLLANVVGRDGRVVSLDGVVKVGDVELVVLGVVDGHDLLGDGRLERIVSVGKLGESVLRHFCDIDEDGSLSVVEVRVREPSNRVCIYFESGERANLVYSRKEALVWRLSSRLVICLCV